MVLPDPPDDGSGEAGGVTGARGTGAGIAEAAGASTGCSRGVPQYSQNFFPGGTSFPQDVQNGIRSPLITMIWYFIVLVWERDVRFIFFITF
jgi:hypothetical protein